MSKFKALIAMSGGVDSAVAALLLKKKYDLTGITMRLWSEGEDIPDSSICSPDGNASDAKAVADILEIPHVTTALGSSFKRHVIDNFISEYRMGRTPNPCVECNRCIKFGKLFEIADKMEIPYLATGHYARIEQTSDGEYVLKKAADLSKDQSYFLWSIKKSDFPLSCFLSVT